VPQSNIIKSYMNQTRQSIMLNIQNMVDVWHDACELATWTLMDEWISAENHNKQ